MTGDDASLRAVARGPKVGESRAARADHIGEGNDKAVALESGSGVGDLEVASRLGLSEGMVVQEFQYDSDVDEGLRSSIAAACGTPVVGEDHGDVVDVVLLWYREGDDDLADLLMDAQTLLDDGGAVWLLAPKSGRPGHVPQRDIEEGASLAGLHATSTFVVGDWAAVRLMEKGRQK